MLISPIDRDDTLRYLFGSKAKSEDTGHRPRRHRSASEMRARGRIAAAALFIAAGLGCGHDAGKSDAGESSNNTSDAGHDTDGGADAGNTADGGGGPDAGAPDGGTADAGPVGFYVHGRDLFDHTGERVILRGVNKMNIFTDRAGVSFLEIRRTGANTVRIVWATADKDFVPTADDLDNIIQRARDAHLIPMIELHDATGDWSKLGLLFAYWTRADVTAVLKKHQQYLLLNVGNEVGDETVTAQQFVDGYGSGVLQLRNAGLHMPIVIDACDYGKNIDVLNATATTLLDGDPDHNLIFSAHTYWSKTLGPDYIVTKLQAASDAGYALVVGEFSRWGAYNGGGSICTGNAEVLYQTILEQGAQRNIGWYAWEWGPGNVGGGDPLCVAMDMTTDSTFATIKDGWAMEVALTSPYSIQNTSVTPASMR
jgi:mannan endo-1,4-beta-mannosidase